MLPKNPLSSFIVHRSSFLLPLLPIALMTACTASPKSPASRPAADPNTATATLSSANSPALALTIPAAVKTTTTDNYLDLNGPQYELEYWLLPNAHSLDDAISQVAPLMKPSFYNFTPDRTTPLTIANAPAKRLTGHGNEGDDDDDGKAELIAFQLHHHFFIVLSHGDTLTTAAQAAILTVTQTAHIP